MQAAPGAYSRYRGLFRFSAPRFSRHALRAACCRIDASRANVFQAYTMDLHLQARTSARAANDLGQGPFALLASGGCAVAPDSVQVEGDQLVSASSSRLALPMPSRHQDQPPARPFQRVWSVDWPGRHLGTYFSHQVALRGTTVGEETGAT